MIDRDLLVHIPVLASVARNKSFVAAAAELGLGTSAVSHAVRVLEQRLGAPFFARTTRSVSLTEAGAKFLAQAMPALNEIQAAAAEIRESATTISGTLRINAPRVAQPLVMTELVATLATRHPDLVVEIVSEDATVDIVADGYDAGVRLGEMIAKDMVAIRLTPPFKAVMVATPEYLAEAGPVVAFGDLQRRNCIGYRQVSSGRVYAWEVQDEGRDLAIAIKGTVRVTDPLFALDLALSGVGVAYLFEPLVERYIDQGRLERVLPETAIEEPGLFLYYPQRASLAPKLRAFIDAANERIARSRAAARHPIVR